MDYSQLEYKEWLIKTKQPHMMYKNKISSYLLKEFQKYKKETLFTKIKNSGFKLNRKPHGIYSIQDFHQWLVAGEIQYIKSKSSCLPRENSLKNKNLYKLFLEYQNMISKEYTSHN